jgi:hypothetical protein
MFERLDPDRTGLVKVRRLVHEIFRSAKTDTSFNIPGGYKKLVTDANDIQSARATFQQTFTGLVAPKSEECKKYSVHDLETQIRNKIEEKSHVGSNIIQSLVKVFGDIRDTKNRSVQGISRDQFCFTLWKKFQMKVSMEDIDDFFVKYDPSRSGYIPLSKFVEVRRINFKTWCIFSSLSHLISVIVSYCIDSCLTLHSRVL